jgi:hypothetical protein
MMSRPGLSAHRRWSRSGAITLGLVITAMTLASAAVPAAAAPRPTADCTATAGVIVAVDFTHWGGPLLRSCGTTPATGYSLINQGGWHTAGTEHDGPGFICRIGYGGYRGGVEYPTPAQESCVLTPPATAYWTYWQAGPGQDTWTYSEAGAMTYHPRPGSVSLWVFGGTNLGGTAGSAMPPVTPDTLRAPHRAGPAQPGTVQAGTAGGSTAGGGGPAIVNAAPVAASTSLGHGSPVPAIIALAIVLTLAGAAIAAVRRRRREQSWQ